MIEIKGLNFSYPGSNPFFTDLELSIPSPSRTLFLGANGTGKSTLLRLLAGHHILPSETLRIDGRSPFYDFASGNQTALVDFDFPLTVDLTVREILAHGKSNADPRLESELIEVLSVDLAWHMHRVSEGQRRRVQLLLALREPRRVLLLDEVTAHLDLVAREDLLTWLKKESTQNGLTVLYATHILDGLQTSDWYTHIVLFSDYEKPRLISAQDVKIPLFQFCSEWIRKKPRS